MAGQRKRQQSNQRNTAIVALAAIAVLGGWLILGTLLVSILLPELDSIATAVRSCLVALAVFAGFLLQLVRPLVRTRSIGAPADMESAPSDQQRAASDAVENPTQHRPVRSRHEDQGAEELLLSLGMEASRKPKQTRPRNRQLSRQRTRRPKRARDQLSLNLVMNPLGPRIAS